MGSRINSRRFHGLCIISLTLCLIALPMLSLAPSSAVLPLASTEGITIEDTLATTNDLRYLTYIQYTTNDQYEVEGTYMVTTNQSIEYDVGHLFVRESININTTDYDYTTIQNKVYNYTINSTSNIPANQTAEFPVVFNGGWQHNYPYQSSQLTLNNQEISYAFKKARDINLVFQQDTELNFSSVAISVQKFTSTLEFQVTCGTG